MTAIIMMLMYKNAVKAFMKGKNLTLGGGISVAAGPIGRLVVESEILNGLMRESNAEVSWILTGLFSRLFNSNL